MKPREWWSKYLVFSKKRNSPGQTFNKYFQSVLKTGYFPWRSQGSHSYPIAKRRRCELNFKVLSNNPTISCVKNVWKNNSWPTLHHSELIKYNFFSSQQFGFLPEKSQPTWRSVPRLGKLSGDGSRGICLSNLLRHCKSIRRGTAWYFANENGQVRD